MTARAMILAAGRGERLRPLTDTTPKPLLAVQGRPLIEWHLAALARAGVDEVVVNTAWLEERFPAALGDGARFGLSIRWSREGHDHGGALETAGGMAKALRWLADPFWLVSGDIFAPDFVFAAEALARFARSEALAHLWLVPNPPFHPQGDFALRADGHLSREGERGHTYANIALVRRALVADVVPGTRAALGPLLFDAAAAGRVTGEVLSGRWENVGTAAQLEALNRGAAPG